MAKTVSKAKAATPKADPGGTGATAAAPATAAPAAAEPEAGAALATAPGEPSAETAERSISSDNPPSEKGGGDVLSQGVSAAPPVDATRDRGLDGWLALEELGDEEAARRWPLAMAAIRAWAENAGRAEIIAAGPTVRIAARREGFRRAGVAHPKAATSYAGAHFTPDELEALLSEPALSVELI